MKYIVILFSLFSTFTAFSQYPDRCFTYDAGGNRIKREICAPSSRVMADNANTQTPSAQDLSKVDINDTDNTLSIAPNPTFGSVQVITTEFSPETWTVLYDMTGKVVLQRRLAEGDYDLFGLSEGEYILTLQNGELQRSLKIIKIK